MLYCKFTFVNCIIVTILFDIIQHSFVPDMFTFPSVLICYDDFTLTII